MALVVVLDANARLLVRPTFSGLMERSALVVVATPLETQETGERTELPNIWTMTPNGEKKPVLVRGVETKFRCILVFKGISPSDSVFVLHHYREAERRDVVINGPSLVTFDPGVRRAYLLFLRMEDDGRYAPAGGQTDPGDCGVHELKGWCSL